MSPPAVFLDRDGTLNREQGFVTDPADLHLLPGAAEAVQRLDAAGFRIVVVTNQSGIARGLYGERDLARIHEAMHPQLGRLPLGYLHCPHHPDEDGPYGRECDCRKPAGGMLHAAAEMLGLNLDGSFVVGDSARDVQMARGLPVRTVLVQSGKPWRDELAALDSSSTTPDHVAVDLAAAAEWIAGQG